MNTQTGSNELRVQRDADIEQDLMNGYGDLKVATTIFIAPLIKDLVKESDTSTGGEDSNSAGTKLEFTASKGPIIVSQLLVPINQAMETTAQKLDDKKKEQIKRKAEKSKEDKNEKERDGIGE